MSEDETFDVVVVGSGAGGAPLAARLALGGLRVLVLEAGHEHHCPYYDVPIMQAYASEDPDLTWSVHVRHWADDEQQARDPWFAPEHDGVLYPRGSTVGGSTAVSAMVTMYPHRRDWQRLADLTGDPSWGPEAMRERIRRLERWDGVDALPAPGQDEAERDRLADHGTDGWLAVTRADPALAGREPRFLDVIGAIEDVARERAGLDADLPLPRDVNAADTPDDFEGMSFVPVAVDHGRRNGARERLLAVAAAHPDRLVVRTGALATRVVVEDGVATAVEYLDGHGLYRATPAASCPYDDAAGGTAEPVLRRVAARKEVVLAAGTFNTVQLLGLSGIGPAEELRRLGIEPVRDLPGVGRNLHDRYEVAVVNRMREDFAVFAGQDLDAPAPGQRGDDLFAEWARDADGPYTTNGSLAAVVARSGVAPEGVSDLVVFALPIHFDGYHSGYAREAVRAHDRLSLLVLKGHTTNRAGTVRLRSADPRDVPAIDFAYFEEGDGAPADDLRGVVDGIRVARAVADRLGDLVAEELVPGRDVEDDADLATFVRDHAWGHHACGTARIGRDDDPMAVLDGDLRVRGIQRLRVVDASVFPDIPGFFIASAVYLVSERAAESLLAEHAPARGSTT